MASQSPPEPVKLICGMITAEATLFDEAASILAETFGPVDIESDVMDFDFTGYYDHETGSPLYRRFISFDRLIDPLELIEAKILTNELEDSFAAKASSSDPPRPINLDPGYVAQPKLILASMKNFAHRIYLDKGVYGEVTLIYSSGKWNPLGWTFPDYGSGRYDGFLNSVRQRLRDQIQQENS